MDLEGVATLVVLLLHWRVLACTAAAGIAAYTLVTVFPWFATAQAILFTCIGVGVGIFWQSAAEASRTLTRAAAPPREATEPSTVVIAACIVAALWGAASSVNWHSFVAGAMTLAFVARLWLRHPPATLTNFNAGHARLSTVAASFCYLLVAALCHHAA
jgi:hypothetical protein